MEIDIPRGETAELIPGHGDEQAYREYVVHIREGEISLSHDPKYAKEGSRYSAGDEGSLRNLKGSELHAFAHEPATVEIDTDGFLFDLFGTTTAERPNDRAPRDDRLVEHVDSATVAAGSFEQLINEVNNTDRVQFLAYSSIAWNPGYDPSHTVAVRVEDESGNTTAAFGDNGSATWNLDPQPRIEPGWQVKATAYNHSSSSADVECNVLLVED